MGIFSATVLGASGEDKESDMVKNETLIVNAAWLDGDTIRIDVTDPSTGANSALALPLREYLNEGDNSEYIAIQAVGLNGKQSGVIEIKNPFYNPNLPQNADDVGAVQKTGEISADYVEAAPKAEAIGIADSISGIDIPNANTHLRPFTPDGSGTVIDNAKDVDGKEFFTINSEDGNEFYLIIDRHRNTDNVYFLNAVTEEDLMSLAQKRTSNGAEGGNSRTSAIPTPPQPTEQTDGENQPAASTVTPEPDERKPPSALSRIGNNLLVFIGIMVTIGGAAYYIKVIRPKKSRFSNSYGDDEDDMGYDDSVDEEIEELEDDNGGDD